MSFRVPESMWQRFGEVATRAGTNRGELLREFIRWYIREAEAKIPPRPRP